MSFHLEMTDKENLYDFLKNILVFDPKIRFTPEMALQHRFITSAMGNKLVRPSLNHSISAEPQIQRPGMQQMSKSTGALTSEMICASLAKVVATSSSLNTSRTTEDSSDILTPNNSQINFQKGLALQDGLTIRASTISPHATIAPETSIKNVASPPLKSILKKPQKSITPIALIPSISSPIQRQQENTLDRKVAFLHQSRPNSTSQLSDQSNTQQLAILDDPIPEIVNVNGNNTNMYNQNYTTQQHSYMTQQYGQQLMAYIAQTTQNTTTQPAIASSNYALSPPYSNANLPYIYQQAQQLQQHIISPNYAAYPYQHQHQQQQQYQQQQQHQHQQHQQKHLQSPLLMYSINDSHHSP